jgi:hypothetical protein
MLRNAHRKERSLLLSYLLLLLGAAAIVGCMPEPSITATISPDSDLNDLIQMVKTDLVTVYATEADRQVAADVASAIEANAGRICTELITPCDFSVIVQVFPDQDAFDRNVMNPEMRGFAAVSGQPNTIQMVSPVKLTSRNIAYGDGVSIAVHEYVHLALDEVNLALPAWLDEGAAVFIGPHQLYDQACQYAFPFDIIPSFQRLMDSYQAVQAPDLFAFAAVDYIVSEYEMGVMNELLRHPDDFETILSASLYEFEYGWNQFMRTEYQNRNLNSSSGGAP